MSFASEEILALLHDWDKFNEGKVRGIAIGKERISRLVFQKLLARGMTPEEAADITGLSLS